MLQFEIDEEKCTRCGQCVDDCPRQVIRFLGDYPGIAPEREAGCIQCQHCLAVCAEGALSIFGLDPEKSIPLAGNLPHPEKMETLIKGRRSVRRYSSEPVAGETIDRMLQVLAHCPTGINSRQNLFTVVYDPAVMERIRQEVMAGVKRAVAGGALPMGMELYADIARVWDAGQDIIFRGAPHLLVVSSPASAPCPKEDALIALTSFDLLAQSMGLGTLWDGLLTWAITQIVPEMKRKMGIPEDHLIGYSMVFGKPAVQYHRTVQRGPVRINRVV